MEREYIVTVAKWADWQEVHKDIINDTFADDSVDSNIVPDRPCPCVKERPLNKRNTHYMLTDEEARNLRNDSRIVGVEAIEDIPEPEPMAVQGGDFDKTGSSDGQQDNWGLIRHTATNNIYGSSLYDLGFNYDYVLDGSGVDIVIMDTGIQADHPEWDNEFGVSRFIPLDWYDASGVSGSLPSNFYTDLNGHGTHCAGTMAGKNFGWAKNALIYSLTTYGNTGRSISFEDAVDCLIGWHNNKPINPATGFKRPTVVNMSFQYSWYLETDVTPNRVNLLSSGGISYAVTGGKYRGVTHSDTTRTDLRSKGISGTGSADSRMFGRKIASKDADVEQLIANGIHVCTAAGNNYMKIDVPGGIDYNNQLTINVLGFTDHIYYHRGASPSTFEGGSTWNSSEQDFEYSYGGIVSPVGPPSFNDGFEVGSLDNNPIYRTIENPGGAYLDRKVAFSDSGPGVDIYAAGDSIISAGANAASGSEYFYGSYMGTNYKQTKKSGTSMATPQVCGMIACVLQAHPDWSPQQIKKYFINNSQDIMYDSDRDDDYTLTSSLHGGNNRIAYLPMGGSKTFGYGVA